MGEVVQLRPPQIPKEKNWFVYRIPDKSGWMCDMDSQESFTTTFEDLKGNKWLILLQKLPDGKGY